LLDVFDIQALRQILLAADRKAFQRRREVAAEVHAAPWQQGAAEHTALLRWFPTDREADPPPSDLKEVKDDLFGLTSQGAVDWFIFNTRNDCAIWLDGGGPAAGGADEAFVVFRGAFVFEQYRRPEDDRMAGPSDLEV
jgi:hypothetical protein